jgi:hypothetical protein
MIVVKEKNKKRIGEEEMIAGNLVLTYKNMRFHSSSSLSRFASFYVLNFC